ncbi:MAG: sulfatase, partial [Pirellulales bacterium]
MPGKPTEVDGKRPVLGLRAGRWTVLAALAASAVGAAVAIAVVSIGDERPPNVLLITLDTARKDHLSCYGYARPTTPNIDAVAGESLVYHAAVAASNWTLPSHASMLTGLFPPTHGAHFVGRDQPHVPHTEPAARMASQCKTLAEVLQEADYRTVAVVAQFWWLGAHYELDQGFDYYDHRAGAPPLHYRRADQITDLAIEWLEQDDGRPFFLFLNYMDPHHPYVPPPPFDRRFQTASSIQSMPPSWEYFDQLQVQLLQQRRPWPAETTEFLVNAYDGEIAYMDQHVGRLFDWLRSNDYYDSTMIVITSDHGEQFGEH